MSYSLKGFPGIEITNVRRESEFTAGRVHVLHKETGASCWLDVTTSRGRGTRFRVIMDGLAHADCGDIPSALRVFVHNYGIELPVAHPAHPHHSH